MGIVLAFAPFIVFAVVDRMFGATSGLVAGASVSIAFLIRDWLTPDRMLKVLEIGTGLLFGGLALYAVVGGPTWSIIGVRLCVDGGLLLIVLVSIAIRRPFTVQYARERVAPEFWDSAEFLRVNYVITFVWAAAFVVLVIADVVMLFMPALPTRIAVIVTILALVAAVMFTTWYPRRTRPQVVQ